MLEHHNLYNKAVRLIYVIMPRYECKLCIYTDVGRGYFEASRALVCVLTTINAPTHHGYTNGDSFLFASVSEANVAVEITTS